MKKKLSKEKQEELDFLKEWSFTIAYYFIEIGISNYKLFIEAAEKGYKENCLKCFQVSITDINIDALELPTDQLTELNRRLKERFGKDLFDMNQKLEKKIQAIIKRKKVRNDEEFRMIAAFLDTIRDVEGREQEVEILEELNFAYEGL